MKKISLKDFRNENLFLNKNSSNKYKINEIYSPIAICLWSLHNNSEAFKRIMMEIHNIITKNFLNLNEISEEKINNFRFVELINYCIFICGIASPPHFSRMKLNFSKIFKLI
jgi:hypothetical protein